MHDVPGAQYSSAPSVFPTDPQLLPVALGELTLTVLRLVSETHNHGWDMTNNRTTTQPWPVVCDSLVLLFVILCNHQCNESTSHSFKALNHPGDAIQCIKIVTNYTKNSLALNQRIVVTIIGHKWTLSLNHY